MAQVPEAWTDLTRAYRHAAAAKLAMRLRSNTGQMRDLAAVEHGRALDEMFAAMSALDAEGVLPKLFIHLMRRRAA